MSLSSNRDECGVSMRWGVLLLLVGLVYDLAASAAPPDLRRPLPGRLRAGYMSVGDMAVLPGMAGAGMNAALVKFGALEAPIRPADAEALRRWGAEAASHGIAFLPVFNWWGLMNRSG